MSIKLGRPRMTPQEFSAKWADNELKESAASKEHFLDVRALVGSPTPREADKQKDSPRVAKHRIFAWLEADILPDTRLYVFPREDDYFFGVLHSRTHRVWALANSPRHGVGNDPTYNNTDCFETFPLPWSPHHELAEDPGYVRVAEAAHELVESRDRWLRADGLASDELKRRTLTNLYNDRPTWLRLAHTALDRAVFAAYGWTENPDELPDEEILKRLLALNLERAAKGATP